MIDHRSYTTQLKVAVKLEPEKKKKEKKNIRAVEFESRSGLNCFQALISKLRKLSFPEEIKPCLTKYWKYNSSIQPYGQFFLFFSKLCV